MKKVKMDNKDLTNKQKSQQHHFKYYLATVQWMEMETKACKPL